MLKSLHRSPISERPWEDIVVIVNSAVKINSCPEILQTCVHTGTKTKHMHERNSESSVKYRTAPEFPGSFYGKLCRNNEYNPLNYSFR
jgi:hypothetical protein